MKTFIHHDIPPIKRITSPNGSRVYETPSGKSYPSITTVTGLLNKEQIVEWRKRVGEEEANKISSRAASRGTRIHSLCEKYLLNEELNVSIFDKDLFNSIKPYLDNIDNIHALETKLYSDHLEVAGTVDCIAEYKNKLCVIDFKTSSSIKEKEHISHYFMQAAAYSVAFEERTKIPVGKILIIMAVENSDPILFFEKRDNWIEEFKTLRLEYKKCKNI